MKTRFLLLTALFALLALAVACGNSPANSNNAVKPIATVSNMSSVNSPSTVANSSMANSSMANKPGASNSSSANKMAPATSKLGNQSAADDTGGKIATTKKPPKGATAVCKDGTYSFAKNDSGQCSGHGGVDKKL